MEEENEKIFDYCNKVDVHALDLFASLETVVSISVEHGFRGIVVPMSRIETLVKTLKKVEDTTLVPICVIDYPFGSTSTDIRTFSILSAKEKGAKEVEVVAPYTSIIDKDFHAVYTDLQNILTSAKKVDISVKYVIDQNSEFIDDSIRTRLCRLVSSLKVPIVSTSLGFYDKNVNHSDEVIRMRNMKNKIGCQIKAFVNTSDPNEFALYPKAGADIIGVEWSKAPYLVHAYEDIVEKKN